MKKNLLTYVIWISSFQFASASWTQVTSLPSTNRAFANSFTISGMAYMGGGFNTGLQYLQDFWQFDPNSNMWTQKANLPNKNGGASCFAIQNKGYLLNGTDGISSFNDIYEYDPITNAWSPKSGFPGGARNHSAQFVIGNIAYVGLGYSSSNLFQDFWAYDPSTDSWTQKATFPAGPREAPVSFAINGFGYVGTGTSDPNYLSGLNDFYRYNPFSDSWTSIANFPGHSRHSATAFIADNKGIVGAGANGGITGQYYHDFYAFDPATSSWTQIDSLPAEVRANPASFTIDACGYICGGVHFMGGSNNMFNDVWRYCSPTGIDEYNTQNIKIYFNSVNQSVEIKCGDYIVKNGKIQIYDMLGKCILTSSVKVQDLEIPIEKYSSGIYSFQFSDGDNLIKSGKLIF